MINKRKLRESKRSRRRRRSAICKEEEENLLKEHKKDLKDNRGNQRKNRNWQIAAKN